MPFYYFMVRFKTFYFDWWLFLPSGGRGADQGRPVPTGMGRTLKSPKLYLSSGSGKQTGRLYLTLPISIITLNQCQVNFMTILHQPEQLYSFITKVCFDNSQ
jgi:hypothetical protein